MCLIQTTEQTNMKHTGIHITSQVSSSHYNQPTRGTGGGARQGGGGGEGERKEGDEGGRRCHSRVEGLLAVADIIGPLALAAIGTVCIGAMEDIVAIEEHLRVEGGARCHQVPQPLPRDATQPREVQVTQLRKDHAHNQGSG